MRSVTAPRHGGTAGGAATHAISRPATCTNGLAPSGNRERPLCPTSFQHSLLNLPSPRLKCCSYKSANLSNLILINLITMGVAKKTIKEGSGVSPRPGQTVAIEYTGWLKDTDKPDSKGKKYDNSDRPSATLLIAPPIVGSIHRSAAATSKSRLAWARSSEVEDSIHASWKSMLTQPPGWDEGIPTMAVGEKATFDISRHVPTYFLHHFVQQF